ncbi:sulfotransferase [Sphingomonas aerolata]|uniref:tetratricopeptide repeat-containing sulfotransferase family protein n=1 Tax=Sphingomonas aerolata TaxID=185951 RepID=UPI002FE1B042
MDRLNTPDLARRLKQALTEGDRGSITASAALLLDRQAALGDQWRAIADVMVHNGEWGLALRAIGQFRAARPGDPARAFGEAVLLARAGRNAEAQALAQRLQERQPADPGLNHFLGALSSEVGDFEAAERHFRAVLTAEPRSGQTWLELSAIHRFAPGDPLLAALSDTAARMARAPPQMRAPLHYALGKALDDCDRVDAAFAAFAEGARLTAGLRPYDADADRRQAEDTIAAWADAPLPDAPPRSGPAQRLFVTGLPRSGTTLVEQILTSHAMVRDGGELNLMSIVAREAGGTTPERLQAGATHGQAPDALAALYDHLVGERFGGGARVVDKTLDIGRLLGLVATVMPDAPILWLQRDPLDTAWSCFRTYFARGVPWSFSLDAIARHFANEDRLFHFWRDRLGDRLMTVDYAALVTDPEPMIRRIEAHMGLPHDPQTLVPHLTRRAVLTSSVAQVRRPISRAAVGAADRYRHHLTPFITAYSAT